MQNVRLPQNLALKEGVFLGDNSTNVTLWRRGQEPKTWNRIRSAMNPEGIGLSEDVLAVKVKISKWRESARDLIARILSLVKRSEAELLTDKIPLAHGKTIEVEQAERGGHPALLAWAKEGSQVQFDDALVAQLFPESKGYEILSMRNDLCLMLGEFKGEAKPVAVPHSPTDLPLSTAERFIREVEAKFAHRIKLSEYPEGTHIPGCECLETEHARRALAAFREAEKQGVSRTELYVPIGAEAVISIITQAHGPSLAPKKELDPMTTRVQGEIFCILHLIREHGSSGSIFVEGAPAGSRLGTPPELVGNRIPATDVVLHSPEGQSFLIHHHEKIPETLVEQHRKFPRGLGFKGILWFEQFPGIHGVEDPTAHMSAEYWVRAYISKRPLLDALDQTMTVKDFSQIVRQLLAHTSQAELLSELEECLAAIQGYAQSHRKREDGVFRYVKCALCAGLPHIIFGKIHQYPFLELFARERIGALLTTPASLHVADEHLFLSYSDERNFDYANLQTLLALLRVERQK